MDERLKNSGLEGKKGSGVDADLRGDEGCCWRDAMSERGALGSRMPPSGGWESGGDWEDESREREKGAMLGELNEVGGPEPEEE